MTSDLYFDDPEGEGPSRETSHPRFVSHVTDAFYYDCTDEFSPFGNDDGADTLASLEEWYEENGNLKKPLKFLKDLIEESWGFETKHMKLTDKAQILRIHKEKEFLFDTVDHAIIATAFGQYKIEGSLNGDLKALADIAIDRQKTITQDQIANNTPDLRKRLKIVDGERTNPKEQGNMNGILKKYLERLDKMQTDLQRLI